MACHSMVAPTSKIASASKASASTWSSFGSMRVSQCGICNFRALQSVETGQAVQPVRPDNLQHNGAYQPLASGVVIPHAHSKLVVEKTNKKTVKQTGRESVSKYV